MAVEPSKAIVDVWNRAIILIGHSELIESTDVDSGGSEAAKICRILWDDLVTECFEAYRWPWAKKQAPLALADEQVSSTTGDTTADQQFPIPPYSDPANITVEQIDNTTGDTTTLVVETDYTINDGGDNPDYVTLVAGALAATFDIQITVATVREGWDHVYTLPADCVTPLCLLQDGDKSTDQGWTERWPFAVESDDAGEHALLLTDLEQTTGGGSTFDMNQPPDQQVTTSTGGGTFPFLEYIALISYIPAWPRMFVDAVAHRMASELAAPLKKDARLGGELRTAADELLERAFCHAMNVGRRDEPMTPSLVAMK